MSVQGFSMDKITFSPTDDGPWALKREVVAVIHDLRAQLAQVTQERDELRADLVWAARRSVQLAGDDEVGFWYERPGDSNGWKVIDGDGADADLCRAIREARRGE